MSEPYDFAGKMTRLLKAALAHVDATRAYEKGNYTGNAPPSLPPELASAVDDLRDTAFRAAIDAWQKAVES